MIRKHISFSYKKHKIKRNRDHSWIALIGFMAAGKSRIGWELSRKLRLNFIDTDKVVERVSCMNIPDIFETYGETTFREYETEVIKRCTRLDNALVSTGGGVVLKEENRLLLKERGPVVRLKVSPETTYLRTRKNKRPLLEVADPIAKIKELMAAREEFYAITSDITIECDGKHSSDIVQEIIDKLGEYNNEH